MCAIVGMSGHVPEGRWGETYAILTALLQVSECRGTDATGFAALTQPFGCSPYWWWYPWDANLGCHVHDAADMAAPMYSPLYAADGGTVEYAGWCDCGLGYYVKINHGNGFTSTYGHMADQPIVQTGQAVSKGQEIGMVGSTGTSTGPHVHFMVELNGIPVDPFIYTG